MFVYLFLTDIVSNKIKFNYDKTSCSEVVFISYGYMRFTIIILSHLKRFGISMSSHECIELACDFLRDTNTNTQNAATIKTAATTPPTIRSALQCSFILNKSYGCALVRTHHIILLYLVSPLKRARDVDDARRRDATRLDAVVVVAASARISSRRALGQTSVYVVVVVVANVLLARF